MSAEPVYCTKCGLHSDEGMRFCKRCGTNLEAVSKVLTGALRVPASADSAAREMEIEHAREFSRALYNLLGSITAFLVLLFVFKGAWWVFFLLFWVGGAVKEVAQTVILKNQIKDPAAYRAAIEEFRHKRKGKGRNRTSGHDEVAPVATPAVLTSEAAPAPPTSSFEFDPAKPPPSVTEATTRHLDEHVEEVHAPRYVPPQRL